MTDLSNI